MTIYFYLLQATYLRAEKVNHIGESEARYFSIIIIGILDYL